VAWTEGAESEYKHATSLSGSAAIVRGWRHRMPAEHGNLQAALAWARDTKQHRESFLRLAVALTWLWELWDVTEIAPWLDLAMAMSDESSPSLQATVSREAGQVAFHVGRFDLARERLELSLRISESIHDPAGSALSRAALGTLARATGDIDVAITWLEDALTLARGSSDRWAVSACLALRGSIAGQVGDAALGRRLLGEAIAIDRVESDAYHLAQNLNNLGYILLVEESHDEAIAVLTESVVLFRETDSLIVAPLLDLAEALLAAARAAEARPLIVEAAASARTGGYAVSQASALERAAMWLAVTGDPYQAIVAWSAADEARARWRMPSRVSSSLGPRERGRARVLLGPAAVEAARSGAALSLDEALDTGLRAMAAWEPASDRTIGSSPRGRHDLTPREREVLALVAAGRTDGEIAAALFISKKTASVHVANIKSKLGVATRVEVALMATHLDRAMDHRIPPPSGGPGEENRGPGSPISSQA